MGKGVLNTRLWLGGLALSLSFVADVRAATHYRLVDLAGMYTADINSLGQIVGTYSETISEFDDTYYGLLTPDNYGGVPIDLGFRRPFYGGSSRVFVNESGQAALGVPGDYDYWTPTSANGVSGTVTSLPNLLDNFETPKIKGIGDDGTILAEGWDFANGGWKSFVWKPTAPNATTGTLHTFGGGNGESVLLGGINSRGNIAGYDANGPFVFIPTTPNGISGIRHSLNIDGGAIGINNAGQIIGNISVGDRWHARIWSPTLPNGASGDALDLGLLPGRLQSSARDINSHGTVVGVADDDRVGSNTSMNRLNGLSFIWTAEDGMQNLKDLVDSSGDGWHLYSVTAINDNGQIVGVGRFDPDGAGGVPEQRRGFLLNPIPIPEPTGILSAMAAICCWQTRRAIKRQRLRRKIKPCTTPCSERSPLTIAPNFALP